MRVTLRTVVVWVLAAAVVSFTVYALVRAAAVSQAAEPPELNQAPARVYGFVEPAGREVLVWPPMPRRVTGVWVAEGDTIKAGDLLCTLENSVERQELDLARAGIASAEKALELSRDTRNRAAKLYAENATAEIEYTQARLKAELDSTSLVAAREEVKRALAVLEQLELRSPIDGVVYTFDVRLGESLPAGEAGQDCPIVLGSPEYWVRLYVEAFWVDRVKKGMTCEIVDAETGEYIGTGTVILTSPYLGRRGFRTEDVNERFDVGYQQVVLDLKSDKHKLPLGLSVFVDLGN